ncbi:MAG: hypothetical protein ABSC95_08040 [Acetobacteraceae bacterium]|jgi:hypothetical protein
MTRWVRWLFVAWPLVLFCAPARADTPAWSVVPEVAYPEALSTANGRTLWGYSVTVLRNDGKKFTDGKKYWLRFDGAKPLEACSDHCDVQIAVQNGNTQVVFSKIPGALAGARKFVVQEDQGEAGADPASSPELTVTFAWFNSMAVRATAFLVVAILLGIVLVLLKSAGRGRVLTSGTAVSLLKAAVIDTDTRTYSLSKVQFYIWGLAIIASYIYLTLARSMVQGAFEFADIPSNLAVLMGISVGTSVSAVGVSSLAGNKGSGDVDPTPSDLITSGGVVAPERLLHLLWTIVGGAAFLVFAFSIPPETINNLPSVPNGFLELMGVSAAGYVGGKIARGPGPNIINAVAAANAAGTAFNLTIDGANLSKDATFMLAPLAGRQDVSGGQDTPVTVPPDRRQGSYDANGMATRLVLTGLQVPAAAAAAAAGTRYLRFTVVNPDGEKASWTVQV